MARTNTLKTSIMNVLLHEALVGAKIYLEDNDEGLIVTEFIEYDSMTHTFTLNFSDETIREISDKKKYTIEVIESYYNKMSKQPNHKRVK
jgi:hypothetical protein